MARIRVVVDTNVLVSGLAYPSSIPGKILWLWHDGRLEVVLSSFILEEMKRVLPRLKRVQLSQSEIEDLVDSFRFLAEVVEPDTAAEPSLRDPADEAVLATLRSSAADYLITGDKDLLALANRYPVLTPAQFWQKFG